MKNIPFISLIVAAVTLSTFANDTLVLLGKDSTLRGDQVTSAFYLNFGVQYSNYSEGINTFLADHAGPIFELEVGIGGGKLVGYFSPWTINPETKMLIWNDTLHPYERFNPIKAGLMLGKRLMVKKRSEWGLSIGPEWVTLSGFKEKEEKEKAKVSMPTIVGLAVGIDYRRDLIVSKMIGVGAKLSYRYTTSDYRVYNKSLDYGTHEIGFMIGIGGKSTLQKEM